ncbi:LPXTG cell wall anchor domain-containing protein [Flavobacterium fluviatile]|uniref:LPXTG cell wall anchor domain-containing protein n=1 Tax=Flavobacterium fluviatile TaxID=1862387 RepID=UPI0013CF7AC2|nr:LPXTG cell wall anchor domain-containing protein [Flavobacterium fluviatile]
MNISAIVLDEYNGGFPSVNVWVNGNPIAQTDVDGKFTIPNVNANDQIKLTYQGYSDYITTASKLPAKIQLAQGAVQLDGLTIKYGFKKTPWLLWLGLGLAVGGISIYAYKKNQKTKTPIKAKI